MLLKRNCTSLEFHVTEEQKVTGATFHVGSAEIFENIANWAFILMAQIQ